MILGGKRMIQANEILAKVRALEEFLGPIEKRDVECWTLDEAEQIKDALADLGTKASIVFVFCMTEEEMADAEREGTDLDG